MDQAVFFFCALAIIAMLFVGALAIVAVLRQAIGRPPTAYHLAVMGEYLQRGLLIIVYSIGTPALVLSNMAPLTAIVFMSAFVGLGMAATSVASLTYAMRFNAGLKINHMIVHCGRMVWVLILLLNVLGIRFLPPLSPVIAAVTWEMFALALDFGFGLDLILDKNRTQNTPPIQRAQ